MHKRPQKKERELGDEDEDEDDGGPGRRTFCAPLLSRTYHQYDGATLLRPSFNSRVQPSRCETDNKKWAVRRMYDFCVKHKLPEVWVYHCENWYHKGRWELWAKYAHKLMLVLKTTMIVERQ